MGTLREHLRGLHHARAMRAGVVRGQRCAGGQHRGIALIQVMIVVAVVTVLGVAMLSSTSLQIKSADNRADAMQADAVAESGLNLAAYYIQNPSAAPKLNAEGYWAGGQGLTIPGIEGKVDIEVSRSGGNYTINAVGHSGESLRRRVNAIVRHSPGFQVRHALSYNTTAAQTLRLNMTIQGDVQSKGSLSTVSGLFVSGNIQAPNVTGVLPGTCILRETVAARSVVIPSQYTLSDFRSYIYNGQFYKATELTQASLGGATAVTLGPTETNPAGIYFYSYNNTAKSPTFSLSGNVTINGTLVMDNAICQVSGTQNFVTAQRGFPALIVSRDLRFIGTGPTLQVNGVAWIGGSLRMAVTAIAPNCRVDGALMFGGTAGVDAGYSGSLTVRYAADRVAVPEMDNRFPSGPRLLAWGRS